MKILGIDTSCDDTAAAVVEDGTIVLSNIVASQIDIHQHYGGIVPEVASRQHLLTILPAIENAMKNARIGWADIDAIAVTNGPGLAGCLLVGVNVAKSISLARNLPLTSVNHLEGHIYANWLSGHHPEFPCLCLIVSGGHTDVVLMKNHGEFQKLGQTRDDAAGEAFDKAARVLGLGYPGGPAIEKAARDIAPTLPLPRAWLKGTDDFSFSGLKTALLHLVSNNVSTPSFISQAAASFQQAVVEVLSIKTIEAAKKIHAKQILVSGGVAANMVFRHHLVTNSPIPVLFPHPDLCTDNAAMIAACGYFHLLKGKISHYDIDVLPNLTLD